MLTRSRKIALTSLVCLSVAATTTPAAAQTTTAGQVTNKRACLTPGTCRPIITQSTNPAVIVQCVIENAIAGYRYPYSYRDCDQRVSHF